MTPKQHAYARHRASGLGQAQAAKAAGYSPKSAKVSASKMEKQPSIRKAIAAARKATPASAADAAAPEFADAESFLVAVVQGATPADPVRVSAARTLIQYQRKRERAPLKSATPTQMDHRDALGAEKELLDAWAQKAAEVRKRLKRAKA